MCATSDDLRSASDESDHSHIELHCEKLVDVKRTLAAIHDDLLAADLDDSDNLFIQHSKLLGHSIRQLLMFQPQLLSLDNGILGTVFRICP